LAGNLDLGPRAWLGTWTWGPELGWELGSGAQSSAGNLDLGPRAPLGTWIWGPELLTKALEGLDKTFKHIR